MTMRSRFLQPSRALRAIAPSGVRRLWRRSWIRRRHQLVDLGPDFEMSIAENVSFGRSCRLGGPAYLSGSTVGDYTYIEVGCRVSAASIGSFCSIAPYAMIGLAEHPSRQFVSTHPIFYRHQPQFGYDLVESDRHEELRRTIVGNDVWIGAHACIRAGVTVGDGAIIGAGAVVTSDIRPYAVVVGVPAREIRRRFDEATVDALCALEWWNRDVEWLRARADEFSDANLLLGGIASDDAL